MDRPAVLIVSNGHGEDAVGAALAQRLQPRVTVTAYPLVGTGRSYDGIPLLEPVRSLPSGGFGLRGSAFLADLRAGALGLWRRQRRTLRGQRGRCDWVVAIGDVFCLWMAFAVGAPVTLVATAKSSRHDPHSWLEIRVIRALATRVFARDEDTATALRAGGVDAAYAGNPLMDTIGSTPSQTMRRPDRHVIVLLPGSRTDAYRNVIDLLHLADAVSRRAPVRWVCALAPGLDRAAVTASAREAGWSADEHALRRDGMEVTLTSAFGAAVSDADVVVALAGTASEQAAGLGKPVVAFLGAGPQFTPKFLTLQQRLLGDALVSVPTWSEAAAVVLRLLGDPEERLRRGAAGRLRMGPLGAIDRIADYVLNVAAGQWGLSKMPGGIGTLSR